MKALTKLKKQKNKKQKNKQQHKTVYVSFSGKS